jgi:hypothetical protein
MLGTRRACSFLVSRGFEGKEKRAMSGTNNEVLAERVRTLIEGLKAALPKKVRSLTVSAEPMPVPRLVKIFEAFLELCVAADDRAAELHAAVRLRDEAAPAIRELIAEVKPAVFTVVGSKSPDLEKFGFKPRTGPRKLTGEERAAATAKARATRAARHTMGRRQKAAIRVEIAPSASGAEARDTSASTTAGPHPAPRAPDLEAFEARPDVG